MQNLSKGEKTRIRILQVATDIFFEKGFYKITLVEIAKEIGITQQAVYKYFESMDEIIISACLHWVKEAQLYIDAESSALLSAKDQLRSVVKYNFIYSSKNRKKDALLIGLYYYAVSSSKAMDAYREIKNGGIHRLHSLIVQGNRENCWSVKRPMEKASMIHSLLVGEIFKMIIEPNETKMEERIKRNFLEIMQILGSP